MNKKNVLHLCLSKSEGGLELNCLRVAKYFQNDGFKTFIGVVPNTFLYKKSKEANLNTLELSGKDYFSFSIISKLKKTVRENNIEVIFVHHLRDLWHLIWIKQSFPNIKIFGLTQMYVDLPKKDFLHRYVYSKMDSLVTLTEVQKNALMQTLPIPAEKYTIIPNGVDSDLFQPTDKNDSKRIAIRKKLGADSKSDILIGMIGRFDRQKGQLEFIDAILKIKDQFPKAKYVFIGDDTKGEESIKKIILDRILSEKLENKVQVRGFTDQVADYLNALDIFVMPSYKETFGIILIEAMSMEKICIATNAGGPLEILDKGEYGLLVEPKSADSLAAGIIDVLRNMTKYENKAKRARQRVLNKYRLKDVITKLKELTY